MIEQCVLCGRSDWIEHHHIFGGANRKKSTKYGLIVPLCHWCHNEPPNGVHHCKRTMSVLHQYGQKRVMAEQGWTVERFIAEFGKNYL